MKIKVTDIDRKIWEEELAGFLPRKIFDPHTHVYRPEHCLAKDGQDPSESPTWQNVPFQEGGRKALDACYAALCPGREVHYLILPFTFQQVDFDAINSFAAAQSAQDPMSVAFMLISPKFSPEKVSRAVDTHGFRGLKPYFFYSGTGDGKECRITDMIPEPLIELANDKNLIIMLHLSKSSGIADEENIKDLIYFSKKYPGVRWVLAHFARSLVPWPLERAVARIKDLPNLWYDFSSVCDSDVCTVAFRNLPLERIMYGSDDLPVVMLRGKYISFGYAWAYLSEALIAKMDLSYCDGRPTFVLYEVLRAARRAALREGFGKKQIADIFYNNAVKLLNLQFPAVPEMTGYAAPRP